MYKSPYYNPLINRADYTYDIAGDSLDSLDSYGAPILEPVEAPDYAYAPVSGIINHFQLNILDSM